MQVLSDPEKRKVYDQFGEEGLKGGIPGGPSGMGGMPGGFTARNPEDILREVCYKHVGDKLFMEVA